LRSGVSVCGDGPSGGDDHPDVPIDRAVLLRDDIAGKGGGAGQGLSPAGDAHVRVGPFMGAWIARNDAEMAGNPRSGTPGGGDPIGDRLVAFVAAWPIPSIPIGGFIPGVAAVAERDLGETPRARRPVAMKEQKDRTCDHQENCPQPSKLGHRVDLAIGNGS